MLEVGVVLLRWIQYGGAVVLLGAPVFMLYTSSGKGGLGQGWARRPLVVAALLVASGSFAGLVGQTAVMAGSLTEALKPASLSFMVEGTALGKAMTARGVVAMSVLVAGFVLKPARALWWAATAAGVVVAASFAWSGHAGATEGADGLVHLAADAAHAIAAALWLGALVALSILLSGRADADDKTLHRALHGFGSLGVLAVALLTVTGLINSWFLVGPGRVAALGSTPYGQLLLVKLALFLLMLGLAVSNRFRLTPGLGAALKSGQGSRSALRRLRRSVLTETLAGAALLAVVAVMGTLAPPSAM